MLKIYFQKSSPNYCPIWVSILLLEFTWTFKTQPKWQNFAQSGLPVSANWNNGAYCEPVLVATNFKSKKMVFFVVVQ
jgi:hypothetical protein